MPFLATGITTVGAVSWGWISSRTSIAEVAPKIAEVATAAKAAQAGVLHCDTEAAAARALALETASIQLEMWAHAEVDRAYSKSPRRSEYMERARRFYLAAFEQNLERYPHDTATALRRARQAVWRPDRDD